MKRKIGNNSSPKKCEGKELMKEFEFKNFTEAVNFIVQILPIAKEANHHPDILIHAHNKVKIMLYTYSEDRITDKDYDLAEKIDALQPDK